MADTVCASAKAGITDHPAKVGDAGSDLVGAFLGHAVQRIVLPALFQESLCHRFEGDRGLLIGVGHDVVEGAVEAPSGSMCAPISLTGIGH